MDPVRNPYSPGAGAPPPALVGRDAELVTCDVAIQRFALGKPERSMLLTGLRGVGKTVLLREFGRLADRHRWTHHAIEITEELKFVEEMSALAHAVLRTLSPGRRVAERARRALGVLKSFQLKWKLPDGGDVVIGLDPVPGPADSGLLDRDLAGLSWRSARWRRHAASAFWSRLTRSRTCPGTSRRPDGGFASGEPGAAAGHGRRRGPAGGSPARPAPQQEATGDRWCPVSQPVRVRPEQAQVRFGERRVGGERTWRPAVRSAAREQHRWAV